MNTVHIHDTANMQQTHINTFKDIVHALEKRSINLTTFYVMGKTKNIFEGGSTHKYKTIYLKAPHVQSSVYKQKTKYTILKYLMFF